MIRKIILDNYMAHVHTVIEPVAGLTVLTGPNNCGKSAIIHALEMICYNSDAADFAIRHGTKKATVTLETVDDDGTVHTLVWWRKKGTAGYIIDGREISGLGRTIPDDLHRFLKMPEIEAGTGKSFRVHFGLQKAPIFLLDDSQSRAAQFFASSSDADRLMEMQRLHKEKERTARRDKDRLDNSLAGLHRQLEVFVPLPEICNRLTLVEITHAEIVALGVKLQALFSCIGLLDKAESTHRIYGQRSRALGRLEQPPVLQAVVALAGLAKSISEAGRRSQINHAKLQQLVELKSSPVLKEVSGMRRLIDSFERARRRLGFDQIRACALESLQPVPKVANATALEQRIAAIEAVARKVKRQEAWHRVLKNLAVPVAEKNTGPISELVEKLEESADRLRDTENAVRKSVTKLSDLMKLIEQWVEQNPRCHTCGQQITAQLIVTGAAEGHAHG